MTICVPSRDHTKLGVIIARTRPHMDIVCGRPTRDIRLLWLIVAVLSCGCRCDCHLTSRGVMSSVSSVLRHNPITTCSRKQRGTTSVLVQRDSTTAAVLLDSSHEAPKNVIVTGANRGLGFAIVDHMLTLGGYRVVLACRSKQEGAAALERLRAHQQERQERGKHQQGSTGPLELPASVHVLDVSCDRSIEAFRKGCVDGHLGGRVNFLFNNAGVCLPEEGEVGKKSRSASAPVMRETLAVNFFGALKVVEACLPALTAARTMVHGGKEKGGPATLTEVDAATAVMTSLTLPTVVWISSGEGELCFLGSKWRGLLADAKSLEDVKQCVSNLLDSATATERIATAAKDGNTAATEVPKKRQEERTLAEGQEEIAFGPTPAYSLSKAAANAAVRTWAPRLMSSTKTAGMPEGINAGNGGGAAGVRLIAVCPGDVLTRMTSEEEMARGDAVSPKEAAVAVVEVALGSAEDFPAGRFYRHGKEIVW